MATETIAEAAKGPEIHVAPGPHFGTTGRSTRVMMFDVMLALVPAVVMSHYVFGADAARVIGLTVASCLATEAVFQRLRHRKATLGDGSAAVTGVILALSLPWTSPWWVSVIGGAVAVSIGKMIFGGLGQNIFNPAMVGRAFLMICFTTQLTAFTLTQETAEGVSVIAPVNAISGATPLSAGKYLGEQQPWLNLLVGNINGSLGETSALALLVGGLYLVIRRSAAWQIPAGVLAGAAAVAGIQYWGNPEALLTPAHHLFGGALMFGAFFIATDPVSSPVSARGRWVFGVGVGALTMLIRLYAGYPEGVMFAVLLMNSVTPMINRWTIPAPVGGKPAKPKPAAA